MSSAAAPAHRAPIRRLTQDLPGSGGRLLSRAADFEVDEVLAYPLEGAGDHLFVRIEKTDLDTLEAARRLVRLAGLDMVGPRLPPELGFAGLKDRRAIARQWISLPAHNLDVQAIARLTSHADEALRVLEVARHPHKLRRGHARANRFSIVVREVPAGGLLRAQDILTRLGTQGVPNTFGPQRFGRDEDNADVARAILSGERRAPRERRLVELLFSALQAEVFNRTLTLRMDRGLWSTALEGDLMQKHDTGGVFEVRDPAAETPRILALAISPTAALPGRRTRWAKGAALQLEQEALIASGLDEKSAARLGEGTRRALRFPLDPDARLSPVGEDAYRLEVTLPSGAYATVVLDELIKPTDGPLSRSRMDADDVQEQEA